MSDRIFGALCVIGLAGFPWFGAMAAPTQSTAPQFPVRADAEAHCPGEVVVWVDLATKIYYYRGQDLYGATKGGAYACQRDVKEAGFRPNRSGR